jgi:hypothetical protein
MNNRCKWKMTACSDHIFYFQSFTNATL